MNEKDLIYQLSKGLGLTNIQLSILFKAILDSASSGSDISISGNPDTILVSYDSENKKYLIDLAEQVKTTIQTLEEKVTDLTERVEALESKQLTWEEISNKPTFSTVAESGNYTDLTNTPDLSIYATKAELGEINTLLDTINGEEL